MTYGALSSPSHKPQADCLLVTSVDGSKLFVPTRKRTNHKTAYILNELVDDENDRPSSIGGIIVPSVSRGKFQWG